MGWVLTLLCGSRPEPHQTFCIAFWLHLHHSYNVLCMIPMNDMTNIMVTVEGCLTWVERSRSLTPIVFYQQIWILIPTIQLFDFNNTRIDNENNDEVADNINDVGVLDLSWRQWPLCSAVCQQLLSFYLKIKYPFHLVQWHHEIVSVDFLAIYHHSIQVSGTIIFSSGAIFLHIMMGFCCWLRPWWNQSIISRENNK